MKVSPKAVDTIVDLHNRGFTNDFQLFGNDLLWVQESLVRVGEFAIVRYQKIDDLIVCGIIALHHNIKGILLRHCKDFSDASPVLIKKLKELNAFEGNYARKSKPSSSQETGMA